MGQIQFARVGDPFTEQTVYGSQMLPTRHIVQPQCDRPDEFLFCLEHRQAFQSVGVAAVHVLRDVGPGMHTILRICSMHGYESLDPPQRPDFRHLARQCRIDAMSEQDVRDALLHAWEKLEQL